MSRDIRFRVWDKEKRGWLLGFRIDEMGFIVVKESIGRPELCEVTYSPGDRYEIVQWTGVNDNSSFPVFEEDICRITGGWSGDVAVQRMYPLDNHHFWQEVQDNIEAGAKYFVMGNTLENPEMLETNA